MVNTKNTELENNFIGDKENKKRSFISRPWEKINRIWIWVSIIATFSSIIANYIFRPNIDVLSDEPFESNNPFSTPFIIVNQGLLAVSEIKNECNVIKIQASHNSSMDNNKITSAAVLPSLRSGGKETIFCSERFAFSPDMYEKAELEIKINFKAWWYPINQTQNFRFIGIKNTKGEFRWIPKIAIDKGYLN